MKALSTVNQVHALYRQWAGRDATECTALPPAGSDRRYYRLSARGAETAIGVVSPDTCENRCFVELARDFRAARLNVPEIYCVSDSYTAYLQEDLGETSLFSLLHTPEGDALAEKCMRMLPRLQTCNAPWQRHVMVLPFSRRQVMWDLNYFKYEYLKPSGVIFDEDRLEDDFERLADDLLATPERLWGFMYRDCQSRNVMVRGGEPWFIDFQGGRRGPAVYDAVSFLWQAKAAFTDDFRHRMLDAYAEEFASLTGTPTSEILGLVPLFALFRTLQVLGAYGFRGLVQHRAHFVESIPGALRNLSVLLTAEVSERYPHLTQTCRSLIADRRFEASQGEGLTVEVSSFSYKRGYPDNYTGNGGGFMFDCRAMHNPGRYAEYKKLTGLDEPVRAFLEERGEVQPYLENVWGLTDPAVERYLSRGFTSLQIGFGCTGGQHRSVYCAEATARHLAEKFPAAKIRVKHREQQIERILND